MGGRIARNPTATGTRLAASGFSNDDELPAAIAHARDQISIVSPIVNLCTSVISS